MSPACAIHLRTGSWIRGIDSFITSLRKPANAFLGLDHDIGGRGRRNSFEEQEQPICVLSHLENIYWRNGHNIHNCSTLHTYWRTHDLSAVETLPSSMTRLQGSDINRALTHANWICFVSVEYHGCNTQMMLLSYSTFSVIQGCNFISTICVYHESKLNWSLQKPICYNLSLQASVVSWLGGGG